MAEQCFHCTETSNGTPKGICQKHFLLLPDITKDLWNLAGLGCVANPDPVASLPYRQIQILLARAFRPKLPPPAQINLDDLEL